MSTYTSSNNTNMSANSIIANNKYVYMDEQSIHPALKCQLCSKPFVDPVTTPGKETFCRLCILSIIDRGRNQDTSRAATLTPITEKVVLDMLNSLLVRCTKCQEINIMRGQLEKHEIESCQQATVLCSAFDLKCPWVGSRDKLNDHLQTCKYEPLRSALGFLFTECDEFKRRLENVQREYNELTNRKMILQD